MNHTERKSMQLTSENVEKVFRDCLFRKEELEGGIPTCGYTVGEGIRSNFAFHSERLKKHDTDILDMIRQLPDLEVPQSFLDLCVTTEGVQWGEHTNMEQLIVLGIASGHLRYCLPRELWYQLPARMPFIIFNSMEKELKARL